MAINRHAFSREKCLEALLLIAWEVRPATLSDVLRVRYLADKLHLAEYGSLGSGDEYIAVAAGALATQTVGVLQAGWEYSEASGADLRFIARLKGSLMVEPPGGRDRVKPLREADLDRLGESEVSCIRFAASEYRLLAEADRERAAQDAAWRIAWSSRGNAESSAAIPLQLIARTLDNSEEVLAYLDM